MRLVKLTEDCYVRPKAVTAVIQEDKSIVIVYLSCGEKAVVYDCTVDEVADKLCDMSEIEAATLLLDELARAASSKRGRSLK